MNPEEIHKQKMEAHKRALAIHRGEKVKKVKPVEEVETTKVKAKEAKK